MGESDVRLAVPASPEYLRMTRMLAAGVASRVGFTLEEVDDLRIAIDEVCFTLLGTRGRPGTISVDYELIDDGLVVTGEVSFDDPPSSPPALSELSAQILDAVVDECTLSMTPTGPVFRMVKRRRGS